MFLAAVAVHVAVASGPSSASESPHWAFVPPERAVIPAVGDADWADHPVDAFLRAKQSEHEVEPVKTADRAVLLRRVYLDLVGVPPARAEVAAFVADEDPRAWERVVDRLLASPAYGERWGRHFMDLWRYTDWFGLGAQLRNSQKHIWRWRDWIIESLNEDLGYDRMVLDMLAADELAPTDMRRVRATGFLARNYYLFNRTTWLDETIEHTAKAFLGLTANCAKCHDHKYDPISQVEYYRLRAIFEPHQVRLDPAPGEVDLEKDGLPRAFDAHLDSPTYLHVRGNAKDPDKSRVIAPGVPAVIGPIPFAPQPRALPVEAYRPALRPHVLRDHLAKADAEIARARERLESLAKRSTELASDDASSETSARVQLELAVAKAELGAAELRRRALETAHAADVAKSGPVRDTVDDLVARAASAARESEHAEARLGVARAERDLACASLEEKGDVKTKAAKELANAKKTLARIEARREQSGDDYTSLRPSWKALEGPDETVDSRRQPYPKTTTGRRTAFARWIVHPRNPLTARVIVNHVWLRHFGRALVDKVTDFGTRSARPLHAELLDWLAVELVENGWSLKHLHRVLVTSRAYQLSSETRRAPKASLRTDPENRYYWRRNSVRLEAQAIRDSLLALSGELDRSQGGPSIATKQARTTRRRSLYFVHSRDSRERFLAAFDDADILACYRRPATIVPQQALALSNSHLSLELARKIARRIESDEKPANDAEFIQIAWETVLARSPDREELAACVESFAELQSVASGQNDAARSERARAGLVHALVNHNDFVTVR